MTDKTCPPFGTGSVDFTRVHAAALKGEDLTKAIEGATTRPEPAKAETPAPEPAPPATKPAKGEQ